MISYMLKKTIKVMGISLLSFALGIAFLSEESLLTRVRVSKHSRVGSQSSSAQYNEVASITDSSESSDEFSGKSSLEDVTPGSQKVAYGRFILIPLPEGSETASFHFLNLLDQYISLPPPV
ncbi:hypothetical protein [Leptospira idonii]|uniref:Uncharacterized protein n=1 Tax=Leptospira idonii TaxID=1193500 RepID=A0A4R9M284_9LEPT|nr:hypothetical protein [Leptospira idonii]TGN19409.1 hypothetical protein EHS15_08690 [Leptospira idonii]